jgi:hypothetical protein
MKWLVIFTVLSILSKVGYDHVMRTQPARAAKNVDEQMHKLVSEMNAKMPIEGPVVRLVEVEYSDRVLRISGVVRGDDVSPAVKAEFAQAMEAKYCSEYFAQAQVGVEYELKGPPRSLNDLTRESWVLSLRPANCR